MSDTHDHGTEKEPAATPAAAHDVRLDASGEEHPGVKPSKFDLIALEQTRYGLRILGLGLFAWSVAHPLIIRVFAEHEFPIAITGWTVKIVGFLCLISAVSIMATTPHGPLPRFIRRIFALVFLLGLADCGLHLYSLFDGSVPAESVREVSAFVQYGSLAVCLLLPWILWRFCQYRGLSGRAIVWLWLAIFMTIGGGCSLEWPAAHWVWFPFFGLFAFVASQQTARDVWLDAIYRHSKFYVVTNPKADVVPLHPADRH